MFVWVRFGEVESPVRRCFCIDVTSDNLLDAVRQTVEEEASLLFKQREAELTSKLREASAEEQSLVNKVARFEVLQEPTSPETLAALDIARARKSSAEGRLAILQAISGNFKGLGDCEIDLIDPASGAMQKLQHGPRKRAAGLLRAGATYELARLDESSTGTGGPSTPTQLTFSLSEEVSGESTGG